MLDYLALHPVPRAWTHIAQQHPNQPWGVILRGADGVVSEPNRPLDVWLPKTTSQQVCTYPRSVDAKIEVAPTNVSVVYALYFNDFYQNTRCCDIERI